MILIGICDPLQALVYMTTDEKSIFFQGFLVFFVPITPLVLNNIVSGAESVVNRDHALTRSLGLTDHLVILKVKC